MTIAAAACAHWHCFPMAEPPPPLASGVRTWTLYGVWLCLLPLLLQLPARLAASIALSAALSALLSARAAPSTALKSTLTLAMLAWVLWQTNAHIGRDTGCALLAAMLAIKTLELHSLRDARSMLGFALFAPFSAFLLDQGPLTTALALLAVLATLLGMQRLADAEAGIDAPLRERAATVARLTTLGLPLALIAFWLFPRLPTPLWGLPDRALARPGLSEEMSPDGWLDLLADDTAVLRAQFFGTPPAAAQRYWRGPVLWDFDGRRWRSNGRASNAPPPPIQPSPRRWHYRIDYEASEQRRLVALDLPLYAPTGARLDADYGLRSAQPLTGPSRWHLQSAEPRQFQTTLAEPLRRRALRLPAGFNPRTVALARRWREQAGDDDEAVVRRMLAWVGRSFSYRLDTPLPGHDQVDEFLFQHRAGFCEHFSSAFVVMMRAAGIPARVVTGYVGGEYNPLGDYWLVRRLDAHAWAEVWLQGRGWVRTDPTAAVAPERVLDRLREQRVLAPAVAPTVRSWQLRDVGDWLRQSWNQQLLAFNAERQQRLLRPLGIDRLGLPTLALLFAVLTLLALAWMIYRLRSSEREPDPLLRAWRRLNRRYADLGLPRAAHEPALQWAHRLQAQISDPGLLILSQRFADSRYAAAQTDPPTTIKRLIRDLNRHRPRTGAPP